MQRYLQEKTVMNCHLVLISVYVFILHRRERFPLVIRWPADMVIRVSFPVFCLLKICHSFQTVVRLISCWTLWACLHVWISDRSWKSILVLLQERLALRSRHLYSMVPMKMTSWIHWNWPMIMSIHHGKNFQQNGKIPLMKKYTIILMRTRLTEKSGRVFRSAVQVRFS